MSRRPSPSCLAALVLLLVGAPPRESFADGTGHVEPQGGTSLLSKLGLNVGRNLVYAADPDDRLRGVERLAALGTPEAIEALLESMEGGSALARDPIARLAVVRALAPFADRADVRAFLVREMMDAGARRDVTSGVGALVRETAALALARRGDPESERALASAASLRGPAGESARAALIAVPPRVLDELLFERAAEPEKDDVAMDRADPRLAPPSPRSPKPRDADKKKKQPDHGKKKKKAERDPPGDDDREEKKPDAKPKKQPKALTGAVMAFLGDLGDLRALPQIRVELDRADRPSRAAAALALAKLGDMSVAKVVKPWLDENDPRFVLAAAEVLVVLGDPAAPSAVKKVLDKEQVRGPALRLAYELGARELAEPLEKLLPSLELPDQIRAVMAIGRAGDAARLDKLVIDPKLAPAAVSALVSCPSADAARVVEKGLSDPQPARRRAFLRAAIGRAIVSREVADGLKRALDEASRSRDVSDVEAFALGSVALGRTSVEDVLALAKRAEPGRATALVAGAAKGALVRGDEALAAIASELVAIDPEAPTDRQVAAGVALLSDRGADAIAFDKLRELCESGGPLAALAARALPRRADASMNRRLVALLGGSDPAVRAGIALGLARSAEHAAVSWLADAYEREDDERVRRAIVTSLARRTEAQRKRPLEIARALDPDPEVRALAAAGLSGSSLPSAATNGGVDPNAATFFVVARADGPSRAQAVDWILPSGIALPVVTAGDGGLLLPGAPWGKSSIVLPRVRSREDR